MGYRWAFASGNPIAMELCPVVEVSVSSVNTGFMKFHLTIVSSVSVCLVVVVLRGTVSLISEVKYFVD